MEKKIELMIQFSTRLDSVEVPNVISRDRTAATPVTHQTKLRRGPGEGKRDRQSQEDAEKPSECRVPADTSFQAGKAPLASERRDPSAEGPPLGSALPWQEETS